MYKFILLLGLVLASFPLLTAKYIPGQISAYPKQHNKKNVYNLHYNNMNSLYTGNNFHKEYSDQYGNKWGSYGIVTHNGKTLIIDYVLDKYGFRAKIRASGQDINPGISNYSMRTLINGIDKIIRSLLPLDKPFSSDDNNIGYKTYLLDNMNTRALSDHFKPNSI